jgi:hypothetical protein
MQSDDSYLEGSLTSDVRESLRKNLKILSLTEGRSCSKWRSEIKLDAATARRSRRLHWTDRLRSQLDAF